MAPAGSAEGAVASGFAPAFLALPAEVPPLGLGFFGVAGGSAGAVSVSPCSTAAERRRRACR